VLGGMMLSKDAIADVVEVVKGADFYRPAHETIFEAVLDLYGRGEPADAVTVADELTKRGDLARVGGAAYLHTLISGVPTAANAGYYAQIVRERAVLRRLVEAGTRIVQLGYATSGGDVDDLVNAAQAEVYAVTERRTSEDYLPIGAIIEGTVDEIEAAGHRDGVMGGVPTGFADLDRLTHGLHPGQMIVVAARPAIGKCLAAGTLITDAYTGRRMTVEEFVRRGRAGQRLAVHTLDERWRLGVAEPWDYIDNGVRDVHRLMLRSGRAVTATANHPLRTLSGWVPLEQLEPGDRVAVPRVASSSIQYDAVPDLLPREALDLVDKARGEKSWSWVERICGVVAGTLSEREHAQLTRIQALRLAESADAKDLADLATSDVVWDEVVAVEPAGRERVFDLTISATHNFVADDVIVHNSTLGLDVARSASIKHGLTSVIFSLEMSRTEITMRLLSAEARIPLQKLRQGKLDDSDWTKMARTMGELTDAPLFIDDSPNMSLMEIRAKCRRLKQRHDLKLVIIDYLQLMQSHKRVESRQQEVSEFSRALKLLAKELDVPVIAISQLNRGPEARTDKRPMMSDLRESGCLTADTKVLRADTGAETTLGALHEASARDVPVWSLDDSLRYVRRHLTHVFPTGVKPVFRVTLASGKTVRATANHPFLTYDGWTALETLQCGARVAVPRHVPAPQSMTRWDDSKVTAAAETLADELQGLSATALGVPAPVASLPKQQIAMFLRHTWSIAGSVLLDDSGDRGRVRMCGERRAGLDDVARLLLRFGISTSVRRVAGLGVEPAGPAACLDRATGVAEWELSIDGVDDQRRFLGEIGVYGECSVDALMLLDVVRTASAPKPAAELASQQVWHTVHEVLLAQAEELALVGARGEVSVVRTARPAVAAPSRTAMGQVAQVLSLADLEVDAVNDVLWDRVVSIEPDGDEQVFDATVIGTHNFIADGIAVHNSIEQDADMVILLHREDAYERESPRAGEADFIVAKHRNGPTDTITVAFQGHYSRFVDMAAT
jgi:replicative DNA helicase